ncbi:unnamed protein product [Linum trigynum]|uniref:Uncharacterized protein n=1 Tax=Linum trigynum TaxID=586398 RepID=A0AAV2E5V7_9ROSI
MILSLRFHSMSDCLVKMARGISVCSTTQSFLGASLLTRQAFCSAVVMGFFKPWVSFNRLIVRSKSRFRWCNFRYVGVGNVGGALRLSELHHADPKFSVYKKRG